VDDGTERTLEVKKEPINGDLGTTTTLRSKVSRNVKEYWWRIDIKYEIFVFIGSDSNSNKVVLTDRSSSCELVATGTKASPFPSNFRRSPIDMSLTWLIKNLLVKDRECLCNFVIDRTLKSCRTPRRNDDVANALAFFEKLRNWCSHVEHYFKSELEDKLGKYLKGFPSEQATERPSLHSISSEGVFVPVLALFEESTPHSVWLHSVEAQPTDLSLEPQYDLAAIPQTLPQVSHQDELPLIPDGTSYALAAIPQNPSYTRAPLLSLEDIDLFLKEQRRSLGEEVGLLERSFPSPDGDEVLSSAEALLCLLGSHLSSISMNICSGISSIEEMLRSQLVDAIGKYIEPEDFSKYMQFHNKKLFKFEYLPVPFCYSVRQPEHYPDGTFSICRNGEAIETICRKVTTRDRMKLPINAATTVKFTGDCFLHAWVTHSFGSRGSKCLPLSQIALDLTVRARQFSSMLFVIGKISGSDTFEPAAAIIVQNKDELTIPLLLEQLPTSKEFKDAIASLSPVQQSFAKAFRSMQLESSVFGICVIQLKPQLERLLGLPPDSLQKEVKLTQNILELFIEYQIPSDLLTFSGDAITPTAEKISAVRGYVNAVMTMIDEAKKKQLADEKQEADMRFEMQASILSKKKQLAVEKQEADMRFDMMERCMNSEMSHQRALTKPQQTRIGSAMKSSAQVHEKRFLRGNVDECLSSDLFKEFNEDSGLHPAFLKAGDRSFDLSRSPMQHDSKFKEFNEDSALHPSILKAGDRSLDLSTIPMKLDAKFDEFDEDAALRPAIIKAGDVWTRKTYKNLLCKASIESIGKQDQEHEKNKAFDLLDALSRSGALPISCTEVHAIVGAMHCFDSNIIDTVVQENINPVDKFERSLLIVASTIHGIIDARALLKSDEHVLRISKHSPKLLSAPDAAICIDIS
jgi:hypothetical protein